MRQQHEWKTQSQNTTARFSRALSAQRNPSASSSDGSQLPSPCWSRAKSFKASVLKVSRTSIYSRTSYCICLALAPLLRNLGHTSYYHALTINNIPAMLLSAPAEVWPLSLSLSLLLCQPRWSIQCKEHNYSDCKASKLGENQSQGRKAQDLLRLRLWQRCYLRPNIEKTFCCKHFAQPACSVHFGELGSWGKAHPAEWLLALCRIPGCCGPSALLWLCRKHVKHLKPRGIKSCAILCCVTPKVGGANTRRLCWW